MVFFNFNIQHLLLGNPTRPQNLSVCRRTTNVDCLQGILRHAEAVGRGGPRHVDREVIIDFGRRIQLYLMQGSALGGLSSI